MKAGIIISVVFAVSRIFPNDLFNDIAVGFPDEKFSCSYKDTILSDRCNARFGKNIGFVYPDEL